MGERVRFSISWTVTFCHIAAICRSQNSCGFDSPNEMCLPLACSTDLERARIRGCGAAEEHGTIAAITCFPWMHWSYSSNNTRK
jgi:hypothetical protein